MKCLLKVFPYRRLSLNGQRHTETRTDDHCNVKSVQDILTSNTAAVIAFSSSHQDYIHGHGTGCQVNIIVHIMKMLLAAFTLEKSTALDSIVDSLGYKQILDHCSTHILHQ